LRPETKFAYCYRPHRLIRSFHDRLPANARRRLLLDSGSPHARLFHGLNQRLPARVRGKAICTFHDLFVLTGEYSDREFREKFAAQARDAARRSDLIICVSEYTAGHVRDLLGVSRDRLRVVPHGVHLPARRSDVKRERFVLHVGAVQTRKNIVRLVQAFEQTLPDYRLVLAGSHGYGADAILARIEASPRRRDIDILGYVDSATLQYLYRRAAVLAYPSLDEGFGIPVLEAMAHELPVLTSNGSALREAAGDAALLVNPTSVPEIASGLNALASDPGLRARLTELGYRRACQFSWKRAVEMTWEAYESLG
jgi:glycosyltransferase involved in cell wall biosynthesis